MAHFGKRAFGLATIAGSFIMFTAQAANFSAIESALQAGDPASARQLITEMEAIVGPDPQLQYLKGLAAHRLGELNVAARTFERLHQQHPETPEPGNNLAVVLAAQGRTLEAASILEAVLQAHPDYLPALENQAALHAQQAATAQQRATALGSTKRTAPAPSRAAMAPARSKPSPSLAPRPSPLPVTPNPPAAPRARLAAATSLADDPGQDLADAEPQRRPSTTPAAGRDTTAVAIPVGARAAWAAHQQWLAAWQRGDVQAYLSHYAPDFEPSLGQSRAAWEQDRRQKVPKARAATISIDKVQIQIRHDGSVDFRYLQTYGSDRYSDQSRKRLLWRKHNGGWKIIREQVLL
jgi:ketosteroid isomerase-like protein